jgi:Protein of unknown function (DUF3119)
VTSFTEKSVGILGRFECSTFVDEGIMRFLLHTLFIVLFVSAFTADALTTSVWTLRSPIGCKNHGLSSLKNGGFRGLKTSLRAKGGSFFESMLSSFQSAAETQGKLQEVKYENVVIDPDFRVAALFLGIGFVLDTIPYVQFTFGPIVTLLGVLFLVQTFRIRFVFDETNNFELKTVTPFMENDNIDSLQQSGENVVVGGANRWDCETIVNYDFFPRSWMDSPFFGQPILIYFKETQTPPETWNEGPGKAANNPEKIANGSAVPGQVHFFPAICNAQKIEQEFQKRNCKKLSV